MCCVTHLIILVCAIAAPSTCHEERLPTEARQSMPMECMSAMVEWAREHPKWRVVSWRCGVREESI
jgi:hypothetical protein